ncbi:MULTISPECIES: arsenate reductase family protein [unclassified Pseudoalteromonas]|uniref:arsenate reductase family protein n=1 Tax=unclassified Pseudoalteromonas TaxID=194690 RepID=UPI000B3CFE6E|nr:MULTISPECIES: arsenate reductase family protein [unclassified Pseudoalteromonas]MDN3379064.1 arsenate reductase family protein [Pseudoalteromonas sp. APC 3893]MDN3387763.1 arsenate reductase family protein [Pseudoalteromonas sp. APC 4017]OUS70533.1 arsenate reductase (glutaredoxin) [Pseudoalteromonas sp. A601]
MVVIHHNPDCGTSRNVLQLIKASGYEPTVIEYLKSGWTKPQLLALFAAANLTPKTALRVTKSPAKELGLLNENVSDEQIFEAMLKYPVLVNRPIVCTAKGVKLARQSETVLTLLDKWPLGPFHKEDGEMILDENGNLIKPQ